MTSLGFVEMDPSEMKRDNVFLRSVAVSFQNAYCFQAKGYSERSEKTAGTDRKCHFLMQKIKASTQN